MIDWSSIRDKIVRGSAICLFDFAGREEETDVVFVGRSVTADIVNFLRREVGGPLAVYASGTLLRRIGILPFGDFIRSLKLGPTFDALVRKSKSHDPRIAISIDARDNFTGCSPVESAHTINELFDLVKRADAMSDEDLRSKFCRCFISPGHVPVISVAEKLLEERNGHAELSLTIARHCSLPEIVVAGELVDPLTLESMKQAEAEQFAMRHRLPFLTREDVLALHRSSGFFKAAQG